VTWLLPWNGGADIDYYTIEFQKNDGTFVEYSPICDGTSLTIIAARQCLIDNDAFTTNPYEHPWGADIYARVSATNVKGTSVMSLSGNGGKIERAPDPPVNLADMPEVTTSTQIGLSWE
jgi:hypothetical protein